MREAKKEDRKEEDVLKSEKQGWKTCGSNEQVVLLHLNHSIVLVSELCG